MWSICNRKQPLWLANIYHTIPRIWSGKFPVLLMEHSLHNLQSKKIIASICIHIRKNTSPAIPALICSRAEPVSLKTTFVFSESLWLRTERYGSEMSAGLMRENTPALLKTTWARPTARDTCLSEVKSLPELTFWQSTAPPTAWRNDQTHLIHPFKSWLNPTLGSHWRNILGPSHPKHHESFKHNEFFTWFLFFVFHQHPAFSLLGFL